MMSKLTESKQELILQLTLNKVYFSFFLEVWKLVVAKSAGVVFGHVGLEGTLHPAGEKNQCYNSSSFSDIILKSTRMNNDMSTETIIIIMIKTFSFSIHTSSTSMLNM